MGWARLTVILSPVILSSVEGRSNEGPVPRVCAPVPPGSRVVGANLVAPRDEITAEYADGERLRLQLHGALTNIPHSDLCPGSEELDKLQARYR